MSKRLKHTKPNTRRRDCCEFTSAPVAKVNREQGVIEGVKLSGLESRNDRRYLLSAYKTALPLYENRPAYVNHPIDPASGKPKPGRVRVVEDALGIWKNVQLRADGPYADLHYLKTHPMADRVCEVAERMPNLFGCSHNAVGEGEYKAGVFEISSIPEVRSVDIVCDPGTTNGLFEQRQTMSTWKEVFESFPQIHEKKKAVLLKLMEDDMMPADMGMDAPQDPDTALKDGFRAAIMAVVDGDGTADEKVGKIKELLRAHEKLTATPAEAAPEEEMPDDKDKDKTTEQLVRERDDLKAELSARALCEQHEVKASASMVKALARMDSDKDREEFIVETKARSKVQSPKSSGPGFKTEVTEQKQPTDAKSFVASIRE